MLKIEVMEAIFYCERPSTRLTYIVDYIFTQLLGVKVYVTHKEVDYQSFIGIRCNYSGTKICSKEVHIKPHGLLYEQGVEEQVVTSFLVGDQPAIFASGPGYDLPFDVFSASFFLLSRYEEYLHFESDIHGRFPARASWAARNNCLGYSVLWEWSKLLRAAFLQKYPRWQPKPPGYVFVPTYDIDLPWAYLHRGLRGWGRVGLDLLKRDWPQVGARWQVQQQGKADPFFTFPRLQKLHNDTGTRPRVFWLLANSTREDINPSWKLEAYQKLIREVSEWSDSGIHPSYYSWQTASVIERDKKRLETIINSGITHSRQHFLRLRLPDTYRALLAAGIRHDYSMGFAAQPGYRAGTTEPFFWYDLKEDKMTELLVHPFGVMDVTLKQYLGYSAEEAVEALKDMQEYCQKEGLQFCTLWHNSSFSSLHGWDGWWEVYEGLQK
jgi:hypothetical protein